MVKISDETSPNNATEIKLVNGNESESEIITKQMAATSANKNQLEQVASETKGIKTMNDTGGVGLPEPKMELIREMRQLLGAAFKLEPDVLYSRLHYDEIMDQSSPYVCWRYLLQRDENVHQAVELAKLTLVWREENRCDTLRPNDLIKDFWLRAPVGLLGKSKNGNDLIYAIGKNFKKPHACVKQTIRDYIVYLLMHWDRQHKHDLAQLEIVFDVTDTGLRNIDLDFSSWLVSIRDFIPARIMAIYIVGIPFIMRPIIRLIISWLPARFKNITHCGTYEQVIAANVDDECIPEESGGKADNKWRIAPIESPWAHELDDPQASKIFKEICEACSFNTSKEYLDKVYKMQEEHEKSLKQKQQ